MARQRLSTWWSYTFCACKTQRIHAHGMKSSPMSITTTTDLSIAQLATTLLRWDWDSIHYVPLMWPSHLQLLWYIWLMSSLNLTSLIASLSTSSTYGTKSNYIGLSKLVNSCTKASGSLRTKFIRSFPISWRYSMQWRPLLPKGGGLI